MTNDPNGPDIAAVGFCPICRQGRQVVAMENSSKKLFVYCQECESEWDAPEKAARIGFATYDGYGSCTFVCINDFCDHSGFAHIINKGI